MIIKAGCCSILCLAVGLTSAIAGPLQEARVTRIFNEVAVLAPNTSGRQAAVNDLIKEDIAIRTGKESRAELKYQDNTLVRLGAQTLFSFDPGSRNMDLGEGLILFQIPRGLGGAEIRTGAVTAAITGTTGFVARTGNTFKVILLEGSLRVKLNDRMRESMEVKAGQMLFGRVDARSLRGWKAVDVDVRRLMKTSKLLDNRDFEKLSDEASGKIEQIMARQDGELQKGELVATNVVIEGNGTEMTLEQSAAEPTELAALESSAGSNEVRHVVAEQVATQNSSPKGSTKQGKKADASSPAMADGRQFLATVATASTPTVTTVNSSGTSSSVPGTVYRGLLVDGSASVFLFGAGSSFDTSRDFDNQFGTGLGTTFPGTGVAVISLPEIRFDNVNPVFDTTLGPRDIALISDAGVEANTATIDLSNLKSFFVAAMSEEISLGKNSSFSAGQGSGFQTLQFYNRSGKKTKVESDFLMPDADLIFDTTDDLEVKSDSQIQVKRMAMSAEKSVILEGSIEADQVKVIAGNDLKVEGAIDATKMAGQAGGDVNLTAAGEIRIERAIAVSDSAAGRENSSGGSITIDSSRTDKTAIKVTNSGQLHALLSAASTGPGGTILLRSAGGDIVVDGGSVIADGGLVDVRNHGVAGKIELKNSTISADIVKVGALGANGTLTVGGGSISADTALRLYAGGSNGSIVFDDHVSLNGNSAKIISANTVTIKSNKIVTVNGSSAASVYTNNANYTGSGGNGSTTGTFAGQGAVTLPHSGSPGIDD